MRRMMTEKEIATVESLRKDGITSLKDAQGNPRFVEGDITMEAIEGITQTYGKWSLSGTHLMIVLEGTIANNTTLSGIPKFATISLPSYILNKVPILWGNAFVERKDIEMIANDWTYQLLSIGLSKRTNALEIFKSSNGSVTLTADRSFRIQFDLLIDDDYDD
jgi:hypothetical protein